MGRHGGHNLLGGCLQADGDDSHDPELARESRTASSAIQDADRGSADRSALGPSLYCRRARLSETMVSRNSSGRPPRSTFSVTCEPIFASVARRNSCEGSVTAVLLKPTMTSPGRMPAT